MYCTVYVFTGADDAMDATVTCTVQYFFISISRYHITTSNYGVEYYHNKKSWMTTAVFQTWFTNWNHDLRWMQGNLKVLLIVNGASSHVRDDLSNIKIQYLPPNTTSKVQHMYQGMCRSIKCHYRTMLTERHLVAIEEGHIPKEIAKGIDLKVTMGMLTASWESITPSLIKNHFPHAGFTQCPAIQPTEEPGTWNLVHWSISYMYSIVCSFLYRSRSRCSRWNGCIYSTF